MLTNLKIRMSMLSYMKVLRFNITNLIFFLVLTCFSEVLASYVFSFKETSFIHMDKDEISPVFFASSFLRHRRNKDPEYFNKAFKETKQAIFFDFFL